ncbi:ankyrin repeat domain-containing protein [Burkholderia cepacia]
MLNITMLVNVDNINQEEYIRVNGQYAFIAHAEYGNLDGMKDLIKRFPQIDFDLDTALLNSSSKGHAQIVDYLLDIGANINANNGNVLIYSATKGHINVVKVLIARDVDFSFCSQGEMAFLQTCTNGHIEVAKLFIENGVGPKINIKYNPEYTEDVKNEDIALREAMRHGHLELGKYLQGEGLDINIHADFLLRNAMTSNQKEIAHYILDTATVSEKGMATAIEVAASIGDEDMTILLASRGANQEGALKHGTEEVLHVLNKYNTKVKLDKEIADKPLTKAQQLSNDIESEDFSYKPASTKTARTKL